jgi:hypothetical protein
MRLRESLIGGLKLASKNVQVLYAKGELPDTPPPNNTLKKIDHPGTKAKLLEVLSELKRSTSLILYIIGHGSSAARGRLPGTICAVDESQSVLKTVLDQRPFGFEYACQHYDRKGHLIDLLQTDQPKATRAFSQKKSSFRADSLTISDLLAPLSTMGRTDEEIQKGLGVHLIVHSCGSGVFAPLYEQCRLASFTSSTDHIQPMNTCAVTTARHLYRAPSGWPFHLASAWSTMTQPTLSDLRSALFSAFQSVKPCEGSSNPIFKPTSL